MTIVGRAPLGVVVAWCLAFGLDGCTSCEPSLDHWCSSDYSGYDDYYGYDAYDPWQDEVDTLPEAYCDWPAIACGDTCCAENWRCNANSKTCFQCVMNANCSMFEGCEGDRCVCTADRVCVQRDCDQACPDWQHCEWSDMGMVCVDNVCDPACGIGFRCEADLCVPYCDKACDDGMHCEWATDAMTCVYETCDPPDCTVDTHCDKGECVANECTDISTDDCVGQGCKCLMDGSCGDCASACDPPCEVDSTCEIVGGVPTCVPMDDCGGCLEGTHCSIGSLCEPNVCEPACAIEQTCAVHGGSAPGDCVANP